MCCLGDQTELVCVSTGVCVCVQPAQPDSVVTLLQDRSYRTLKPNQIKVNYPQFD